MMSQPGQPQMPLPPMKLCINPIYGFKIEERVDIDPATGEARGVVFYIMVLTPAQEIEIGPFSEDKWQKLIEVAQDPKAAQERARALSKLHLPGDARMN